MRFLAVLAASLVLVVSTSANSAETWRTYTNARFGYSLCYPANRFTLTPEADNGDGLRFAGGRGTALAVYGSNMLAGGDLAAAAEADASEVARKPGSVNYKLVRAAFYVVSGTAGESIVYWKTVKRGDAFASFRLSYPARESALWSGIVARMNKCFAAS